MRTAMKELVVIALDGPKMRGLRSLCELYALPEDEVIKRLIEDAVHKSEALTPINVFPYRESL